MQIKKLRKEGLSYIKIATSVGYCKQTIQKYLTLADNKPKITNSQAVISWRKNKKINLVNYKGGKCQLCGYKKCVEALSFHHLNPLEKDFTISGKSWSYQRLKNEVDKCILLCNNCHIEVHHGLHKEIPH